MENISENTNKIILVSFYKESICHQEIKRIYHQVVSKEDIHEQNNNTHLSVTSFIDLLKKEIIILRDSDNRLNFLTKELEYRKNKTIESLKIKNKLVYEHNKNILLDIYAQKENGITLRKYTEKDFLRLKQDIKILFLTDEILTCLEIKNEKRSPLVLSVEDEVNNRLFLTAYYQSLNSLSDLERRILLAWFDENGMHTTTAKDISRKLEIPSKQVYQEKNKALKKLSKVPILKSYNEEN